MASWAISSQEYGCLAHKQKILDSDTDLVELKMDKLIGSPSLSYTRRCSSHATKSGLNVCK